ncbi:hypothetical protein BC828DRAFT_378105 [Blastocladiella britannica]|nr:hypothetical protein BC828DRAFT_378105 [Blastocladiella britannica]
MPEQDDVMFDLARATGPPSPTLSVASSLAAELAGATGGVMGGYDLHSLSPIAASGDLHVGDSIGGGGGAGGGDSDFDDFANDDPAAVSAPPPTLVAHRTVLDMDTVVTTYAYPAASSSSSRRASYMGPSGAAYARGDYVRPQQQQRPMSSYTPPPRSGSHRMSSYAEPPRPHRASSSIGSGSSSDELKRARRVTSASMHGYGSASGSYAVATAEAATADWQRPAPEAVPPNPFEHPNDAFADAGEMPTDDDTIDSDDGLDHADHRRSIYATNPASEYDHLSLAAELGGDMEEAVDLHHRRQSSRRTRRFPIGDDDSDDHDEDEEEELDPDLVRAMMEMPPPEAAGIGGGTGANGMSSLEDELADAEMKRFSTLLDRVATQITDLRAADEKLTTSLHAMDATCATCHLSDDNVCHSPDHEHSVGTATTERGTAAAEAL